MYRHDRVVVFYDCWDVTSGTPSANDTKEVKSDRIVLANRMSSNVSDVRQLVPELGKGVNQVSVPMANFGMQIPANESLIIMHFETKSEMAQSYSRIMPIGSQRPRWLPLWLKHDKRRLKRCFYCSIQGNVFVFSSMVNHMQTSAHLLPPTKSTTGQKGREQR